MGKTRPELYAEHVKACGPQLPKEVSYLLVDGCYTKKHFVDTVCGLEQKLDIVGKLRGDANLRYFYRDAYSGFGRSKRYDGKVDFAELSRFVYEGAVEPSLHSYV